MSGVVRLPAMLEAVLVIGLVASALAVGWWTVSVLHRLLSGSR